MTAVWILLGVCAIAGFGLVLSVHICAQKRRDVQNADCLIVLGAKVKPNGELSHTLASRCAAAVHAYRSGIAPVVIACGGRGCDEPCAEADAMAAYLIADGIPECAVRIEAASQNTYQNLINAKAIMRDEGFETCALVTSDYHLQRALWLARDLGLRACGIPAKLPRSFQRLIKSRLQESVSWVLYFIRKMRAAVR